MVCRANLRNADGGESEQETVVVHIKGNKTLHRSLGVKLCLAISLLVHVGTGQIM